MNPEARYDSLLQFYGAQHGVDWLLLKAQIRRESDFNPQASSPVGAKGLAQFMARTWQEWCDGTPGIQTPPPNVDPVSIDPRNPEACISAQAAYMAWLFTILHDTRAVLAAYNWGVGRAQKALAAAGGDFDAALATMPQETQEYVPAIMAFYAAYQQQLAPAPGTA